MRHRIPITSASGAVGRLLIKALAERGHTVMASMRDAGARNKEAAAELASLGAHVIEMDMADNSSRSWPVQALKPSLSNRAGTTQVMSAT